MPMQSAVPRRHYPKDKEPQHFHAPHLHDHNCADCHHHEHEAEKTNTSSLVKKIHEHNGHQCISPNCPIEAPHGHNSIAHHSREAPHNHKHNKHENHSYETLHHHEHDDHLHNSSFWPLENSITHAPMPKWLKEVALNTSFLSPALIVSALLENTKLPKLVKTWLAITAMHGMNRGTRKLARLGLTYLVSAIASAGSKTKLGATISRFIATSCIAVVEKFSGNSNHKDSPNNFTKTITNELGNLVKNMGNKKQWLELLPSLFNIETKVQVVAPFVNRLIAMISHRLKASYQIPFSLLSKILLTSISFVGTDKFLLTIIKSSGAEASNFVASFSTICGCCASPVCSAAATDTALSNTL